MSRATDALEALRDERRGRLNALGPRPPWWRLFARRRWDRRVAEITAYPIDEMTLLLRDHYSNALEQLAARPAMLANIKKDSGRALYSDYVLPVRSITDGES